MFNILVPVVDALRTIRNELVSTPGAALWDSLNRGKIGCEKINETVALIILASKEGK